MRELNFLSISPISEIRLGILFPCEAKIPRAAPTASPGNQYSFIDVVEVGK